LSDAKSQPPSLPWKSLRSALADWYGGARRPLPWRTEPSLYRTVVSEFMCQQTQIDTALPYFARWIEQFPDFAALAAADEETVLTAWSGLGYYARARNLQKLARELAALSEPPRTAAEWKKLPGVGPYIAAAVCSITFGEPVAVVDGNVIRVLSRLAALSETFSSAQAAQKAVQPLASAFLDPKNPGDHNQAVMELGAKVCLKHRPACLLCPLRGHCQAHRTGIAEQLPRIQRKATERVQVDRLWLVDAGKIWLHRQESSGQRLANLVELPQWRDDLPGRESASLRLRRTRGISHQRIEESIWEPADAAVAIERLRSEPGFFPHPLEKLGELPMSGPHRRWIGEIVAASSA